MFSKNKIIKKEIASLAIVFVVAVNCKFLITYGNWLYARGVQNRESLQQSMLFWWILIFCWALFGKKSLTQSLAANIVVFPITLFVCALVSGIGSDAAAMMIVASAAPVFGFVFWVLNKFEYQ